MMRFVASFIIACVIALMLFEVMFRLVNHEREDQVKTVAPFVVDVSQVRMPEKTVRQQQPEAKKEPVMAPMAIAPMAAPVTAMENDIQMDIPVTDLQWENKEMGFEQKYWSQPTGTEGMDGTGSGSGSGGDGSGRSVDDYIGEMNVGKKEITPAATTRPNIPRLAYDNHINGWVLLAFTVTGSGQIKNIRFMDAYPRGVFEANAIAAVRGWKYDIFKGPDVHLAQRIEFEWEMYPYNMDRE